jgi:hypothetical protein
MSFERHVVVHAGRTDVAEQIIKVRKRYADTKLVVLSARDCIEAWEPNEWYRGSDITFLCDRLRRHRYADKDFSGRWVVVVDMLDQVPISPAYNKLFKTKSITVVAITDHDSMLNEHRFGTRIGPNFSDYVTLDVKEPEENKGWFASWFQ